MTEKQQEANAEASINRGAASSFWASAPGMLTGIAAIITAIIGAYAILHHPAPTATLVAVPSAIQKGQSSTLTWQTSDATVVKIEEIGALPPNGSQQVTPDSSIIYHLTATGVGGIQKATAQILVTVQPQARRDNASGTPKREPEANPANEAKCSIVKVPDDPRFAPLQVSLVLDGQSVGALGNRFDFSCGHHSFEFTVQGLLPRFNLPDAAEECTTAVDAAPGTLYNLFLHVGPKPPSLAPGLLDCGLKPIQD